MHVRVRLMGVLKDRTPDGARLIVPAGTTVAEVLEKLQIPPGSVQVLTVNGSFERNRQRVLAEDDELSVVPPVGGG